MSAGTIAAAILLGLAAGVLAGMFGVGGGILFVPTLVALGLSRSEAEKGVAAARDEIGPDADHQSLIQAVLAR